MRVLLQQRPSAGEAPRYVQLTLQPDLFGSWELLRESGQIGGRAQLKREQYLLPVSYTHLDVYKRQVEAQLKRLSRDRTRPLLLRGDREQVLHDPVSYTHLDVYKRQPDRWLRWQRHAD